MVFLGSHTVDETYPEMYLYSDVLQVPLGNGDETNEGMEASAEHAFVSTWAHRSALHSGTGKILLREYIPLHRW